MVSEDEDTCYNHEKISGKRQWPPQPSPTNTTPPCLHGLHHGPATTPCPRTAAPMWLHCQLYQHHHCYLPTAPIPIPPPQPNNWSLALPGYIGTSIPLHSPITNFCQQQPCNAMVSSCLHHPQVPAGLCTTTPYQPHAHPTPPQSNGGSGGLRWQ